MPNLALTWQLSEIHGWGLVGVHTALHLAARGCPPLLLEAPAMDTLRPANRAALHGLEESHRHVMELAASHAGKLLHLEGWDVLHGLGTDFGAGPASERFRGRANIGVVAYEDTRFDSAVLERARRYDKLVVHSTYNHRLLAEQGFANVGLAFQGIDPEEIGPRPPSGRFGDRFVVFSGGKLEFRKAQDVVLTAFRLFQKRHPEALLVTAWHNPWPASAQTIAESPLTRLPPEIGSDGLLRITDWALRYGVPADAFVDLGFLGRDRIAPLLADCHAAVFPNRCEGGTNLVAMEAMGCGVPVVLSANTGHLDLIGPGPDGAPRCWPLTRQTPLFNPGRNRAGWRESSVEELVEALEAIHRDRAEAKARADRALAFIHGERTWSAFAESFVAVCAV
ncbi:glycosyltransferase family 4 protein [Azospirillum doebereinerae]|uniref:glycosyltransferase family 4 protein n=1 Tax=Azospirillum doebereinerae TaxID=92933 RepID=UPI001FD3E27A|nr:glycosyltransferase family 4 protein [Azospirillum doebereinerae]